MKLGSVASILNGYAFKSNLYSEQGIRIIRIMNVQDGYIEDSSPKFYPSNLSQEYANYQLNEGDLLMSLTGNVGRVGILSKEFLPAALNQRVASIRPQKCIERKFLYYTFLSHVFQKEAIDSSKGVAQLNMSTEWLKQYMIAIPPLAEQKRICNKIYELFCLLDSITELLV